MAGALRAAVLTINATAMHAKARAINSVAEANRTASHGPRVRVKEKARKTRTVQRNIERCQGSDTFKQRQRPFKKACQALNNRNPMNIQSLMNLNRQIPQKLFADILWCDDNWSHAERNDGWSSVGWHEGWNQTYDKSASSLSLRSFDLGAMSSPKRFEWARMNLDTGASVNTFSLNFGPERSGDGRFYRTASG